MKVKEPAGSTLPTVALISGRGSNLQALIEQMQAGALPVEIRAVISNRPRAPGLEHARRAGLVTHVLEHLDYPTRESFDNALQALIDRYRPALVVLAGFMRILSPAFVAHYRGRLLNIHPSLLPAYPGLRTHERAVAERAAEHGASVHFVTDELDGGPVIVQAAVPVHPDDDAERLAARVLEQEHRLYPAAVRWFAQGRLQLDGNRVRLDGRLLDAPVRLSDAETAGP
ncbi:MAG: phosphoribosylglycinamide formyltransferase [Gammaproteobacteria bacterium]